MTQALWFRVGVVVVAAVGLVEAGGAARRNWTYLQLTRGRDRIQPIESGAGIASRPEALLALRRGLAQENFQVVRQVIGGLSRTDTLAPLLVVRDAEHRAAAGDVTRARAALASLGEAPSYPAAVMYRIGQASEAANAPDAAVRAYALGADRDAAGKWNEGRYRILLICQRDHQWQSLVDLMAPMVAGATDAELLRPIQTFDPGGALWQGTLLALGEAYEHLGNTASAEAAYDRFSRVNGARRDWTLNRALVALTRARRGRGDFASALPPIVRALDIASGLERSYRATYELDTAAEADRLVAQVRDAHGLPAFQASADALTGQDPRSAGAWFVRGLASEAACDTEGARSSYARARSLVPAGTGAYLDGRPADPPTAPCKRQ